MIDYQFGNNAEPALVGRGKKGTEIVEGAEVRIDVVIVRDVVAVVAHRRGIERQEPKRGDTEFLEVIKLINQSAKIADAIAIAVGEGLDVQLVDDRVFLPKRVDGGFRFRVRHEATQLAQQRG